MTIVSRRASRPVAVLGALALVLMHGAVSPAHAEVFDAGHVDAFYVTAPGGELTLSMKEDITGSGVVHSGDDVTLKVAEEAWNDATVGIDGIGVPTYYLPQTQDSALLWPGWDTQPAQSAGYKDVDFEFVEVTGPGDIFVFETAGFGDIQPVTEEGAMDLVSGDVINQAYPAHRHVNWAFTDPGMYTMTVQAVSNGDVSNQVTYTWNVGDADTATLDSDEADEDTVSEVVEHETGGAEDAGHGDAPRSSGSHTSPHSDTDTAPAAAAGSAPAAKTKDSAQTKATAPKKERKESKTSKESKYRKPSRDATSAAGADDVDTVVASGYYDSGQGLLPWGIGILGLGMFVLGLAIARLALLKGRD